MTSKNGYIYCITNPPYALESLYKLGYTASLSKLEEVKKKILQRYKTYFVNPNIKIVLPVRDPSKAEKKIFLLLKQYNSQREFFKCDYNTVIVPVLDSIKEEFKIIEKNPQVVKDNLNSKLNTKLRFGKKLYCSICDYTTYRKSSYDKHVLTFKHQQTAEATETETNTRLYSDKKEKNASTETKTFEVMPSLKSHFECKVCLFQCSKESNFKIHESTRKHIRRMKNDTSTKSIQHLKPTNETEVHEKHDIISLTALILDVAKTNQELQKHLLEIQKKTLETFQKFSSR